MAVLRRSPLGLALAALLLATSSAGASGLRSGGTGGANAHAYAIKVVVPGQSGGATPTVAAPPRAVQFSGSFSYGDAGAVTAGSATASVAAESGTTASASASAEVESLSLFGGEITASSVVVHAQASAKPGSATGDASGST